MKKQNFENNFHPFHLCVDCLLQTNLNLTAASTVETDADLAPLWVVLLDHDLLVLGAGGDADILVLLAMARSTKKQEREICGEHSHLLLELLLLLLLGYRRHTLGPGWNSRSAAHFSSPGPHYYNVSFVISLIG